MKPDEIIHIGALLDGDALGKEYRARKKAYLEEKIAKDQPVPEGWEIRREFKTFNRIAKDKAIGDQLEDKVWTLLHDMGAQKLNTRRLILTLKIRSGTTRRREIDVLSVDQGVVFVVECKSKERLGKKSLRRDIADLATDMQPIRNAVKSLLGETSLRFVFVFATENIEWDRNDREDAKEHNILVWDEYDIMALHELAAIAGQGAKYQLYNRVFFSKKIKDFEVRVPALKAKMGGHVYYSFLMTPEHLLKIAYVHQRSGSCTFLELSDSYQRMIKASRVRDIEQYIEDGGFFPGSIIVNFNRKLTKEDALGDKKTLADVRLDGRPVLITLPPYYGCAWVVDGQHRLYGYADSDLKGTETVPVVAFVEESPATQAKIFVDINKNQKAIESALLWDLCEDLYSESDDPKEQRLRAISRIAKRLNSESDSPFYEQVVIPKDPGGGNITLTTICTSLKQQRLIAPDEGLLHKDDYELTVEYASDRIAAFFQVFKDELPTEWAAGDDHYVRTNAGFVVLLGILKDLLECNLRPAELADLAKFRVAVGNFLYPLLYHLQNTSAEQIAAYRAAGGAGQGSRQVRLDLTRIVKSDGTGFRSPWLETQEKSIQEKERRERLKKGVGHFLDLDESDSLEFKGSLCLNVDRWLLGEDGVLTEDDGVAKKGVLKTIVGFLNTKGGHLLIGVLEKSRYGKAPEERLADAIEHDDKIVIGIDNEYDKSGWDGFLQRLVSFIETHIGGGVIDTDLVRVSRQQYEELDVCVVSVTPAESKKYLSGDFYIRRGNKTIQLKGTAQDDFWRDRIRPGSAT